VRVLLVDDHEIVRQGLRAVLETHSDLDVVGEAGTAEDAVRRVGFDEPDVVVMDVRLPDTSGVEACREIRSRFPGVAVLMLTSYADEHALTASALAGASGYVLKRIDAGDLVDRIRRVGQGEMLLDGDAVKELLDGIGRTGSTAEPVDRLSPQQRRILDLIATGMTNRQIAEELFLAEKTVKNYVSDMLTRLGMSRRSEAAAYAARLGARDEHSYPPESWDGRDADV
jgi:DNA-binding NarL/FixJ family response regulator